MRLTLYNEVRIGDWPGVNVFPMLTPWVEGDGDSPLVPHEGTSCWLYRRYRTDGDYAGNPGDAWGINGTAEEGPVENVDYSNVAEAQVDTIAGRDTGVEGIDFWSKDFDVTDAVGAWAIGEMDNHGFMLTQTQSYSVNYFYSSESAYSAARPMLIVEYETIPWTEVPDQTVLLKQGSRDYTGCGDTILGGNANWNAYHNYGSGVYCSFAGTPLAPTGDLLPGLIRFDDIFGTGFNQVPAEADILSAKVRVLCHSHLRIGDINEVVLWPMLTDWVEGDSWYSGEEGTSTWAVRRYRSDGDYAGNPADTWGNDGLEHNGPVEGVDYRDPCLPMESATADVPADPCEVWVVDGGVKMSHLAEQKCTA